MYNSAAVIVVVAPPNGAPRVMRGMADFIRIVAGFLPGAWRG